jgi:type IX secretion system PorP/SprF family membrane protein
MNVKGILFYSRIWRVVMLLSLPCMPVVGQQRVQFTQYMFNGLAINPAYAGADEALSLTFIQRRQWSGIENAPTTQTLTAHTLFRNRKVGLGLMVMNDRVGVHRNLNVSSTYAFHLQVAEKSYVSMGIQAGIKSIRADYASLGNPNNDPRINNAFVSETFVDLGSGVYFRSPRLHLGFSALELLPQVATMNDSTSIALSQAHFFLMSRYRIPVSKDFNFEPSVLLKYVHDVPLSYDVNLNMVYRNVVTMGFSYRKKESVDFLFKGQITPQLQFGYSYDHALGEISRFSNGSHELMVHYLFRYVRKNISSPR